MAEQRPGSLGGAPVGPRPKGPRPSSSPKAGPAGSRPRQPGRPRPDAGAPGRAPAPPLRNRTFERALVIVAAMTPLVIGFVAASKGWRAAGDNALIGLRVSDLLHGELLTTGLPTTGEHLGSKIVSNHPGPLPFYLLAPFELVYGIDAGLAIGAAAINGAAWGISVWVVNRRHGLIPATLTLGVLGVLTWGLGAHLLYDPVSSNIAAYASIALVLVAGAVIEGDWKLLPLFVIVASYVIQAHLTYVALGIPLVILVGGALLFAAATNRPLPVRSVLIAAGIGVVVWAPVFFDQFFRTGNISSIVRTFSDGNAPGKGLGFAGGRLLHAVAPLPLFARETGSLGNLRFLQTVDLTRGLLGVAVLVAFAWAGWRLHHVREGYSGLLLVLGVVIAASVYSATKLPAPSSVKAANLRWMWTGGALIWLVILIALADEATRRWRSVDVWRVAAGLSAVALLAGAASYWSVDVRDEPTFPVVDSIRSDLTDRLDDRTYILKYEGTEALLAVGPPIVSELIHQGIDVRLNLGAFDRAYGKHIVTGRMPRDTPTLIIASAKEGTPEYDALKQDRPTEKMVAEGTYRPAADQPAVLVRVFVAEVDDACRELSDLAGQLTAPASEISDEELLSRLADFADERMVTIEPLLTKRQLRDLNRLLDRAEEWQSALEKDPGRTLEEVAAADADDLTGGVDALAGLCGQS